MDGRRMKTILICFLLIINAVLAAVVSTRTGEAESERAQMARDTITALSALDASVDLALLSTEYPTLYLMEEERSYETERTLFGAFIGAQPDGFYELGSGIYQAETESGMVRISNAGIFEIVFTSHTTEADEAYNSLVSLLDPTANTQLIGGVQVFNRSVQYYTGAGDAAIQGGLLLGETYVIDSSPSKSAAAALLALAGTLRSAGTPLGTVTSLTPGYMAELSARGYTSLRPVWCVEAERGAWYVDALTLQVVSSR